MSRLVPLWLAVASVAFAQETSRPAPAQSAPPAEDAIAAAKRDFNTIKSAKGSLEQPKAEMPSLTAPELQTAPAMPRQQAASKLDAKAAKKSANWLVDAMMKHDETASSDSREQLGDTVKSEREGVPSKNSRSAATGRDSSSKGEDPQQPEKRVGPEFNPLARYMAGWMTPQDYALLKPGLEGSAAASLASRGDPSLPVVGADWSVLGDAGSALDLSRETKATRFELSKPAENPFLQSVSSGTASPASAFVVPSTSSLAPPTSPRAPTPVEVAPAKLQIPDFAKPARDEKYFKQLKRF